MVKYTVEGTQCTLPVDFNSHLPLGIFKSASQLELLKIPRSNNYSRRLS
jgi:hypothetical protein